jgi:hypothetical protein
LLHPSILLYTFFFLHPSILLYTFFLLHPSILLYTFFFPLQPSTKFHTHIKQQVILNSMVGHTQREPVL